MFRIDNKNIILIWLIIFFACSLPIVGERKQKIKSIETSIQTLSDGEIEKLNKKFPELGLRKHGITKVRNTMLDNFFPQNHFYKILDRGGTPPYPFLLTIIGEKHYRMPYYFNRLLKEYNLEVNNKDIIELTKVFVLLAIGNEPIVDSETGDLRGLLYYPHVTFLESKSIKEEKMIDKKKNITYTAILKVKVMDRINYWYLAQDIYEKNQFGGATLTEKR